MKSLISQQTHWSIALIRFIKKSLGATTDADADTLKKENEELKEKLAASDLKMKSIQAEVFNLFSSVKPRPQINCIHSNNELLMQ